MSNVCHSQLWFFSRLSTNDDSSFCTIICSTAMIHLFLCSSFANPLTIVGNTVVKATQVEIKPAHVLKGCKENAKSLSSGNCFEVFSSSQFDGLWLHTLIHTVTLPHCDVINGNKSFTGGVTMSSDYQLWMNIYIFELHWKHESVFLNAYSIWYLNMRTRKKAVDICILDKITILEVILFVLQVYFQNFLILLPIVNHWQLDGHFLGH